MNTNQNNEFAPPPGVKRWGGNSALELMEEAAAAREDDLNTEIDRDPFCSPSGMQATREYHQEREHNEAARAALGGILNGGNHARQAPTLDQRLRPVELDEFLSLKIPARKKLLAPILPEKGLVMLYAGRGIGKTHIAHGIACAVSAGGRFLKWSAPGARRVLIVDGEMPASELQERLRWTVVGSNQKPHSSMLKMLSSDLIDDGIGNLAAYKVQAAFDPYLVDVGLLILDNLSSLTAIIRDNDAESWTPIQEWLLRLRRRGISVLIVHHAGKGGEQRGTSRREDVLDTSISLRRPADYVAAEGARFEVHIEKGRGIHGPDAKPFEARLDVRDGAALWTMREIEDVNLARVSALLDDGLSIRDIADETGIKKSTVHNLKKKLDAEKGVPQ